MGWGKASSRRCRRSIWNNGTMFNRGLTSEVGYCLSLRADPFSKGAGYEPQ
ncbi:hypothetical protein HAP32_02702 [Serratia fonticola]|nr:hypothetical protein HAP32_02702 [Serratia fonticola]RDL13864.1 hypothetical protein DFO62_13212 [Serratia fonticola]CAI1187227.1 Uncharacterised protein [Serratia fonticola]